MQGDVAAILPPDGGGSRAGCHDERGKGTVALVLCSGGVDSTTLLALAVKRYGRENVGALAVSYGQKHIRELESARAVCAHYGVPLAELDLGEVFAGSSCALLSHSQARIPHESYGEQLSGNRSGLVATYVPFRNGLFVSAAASVALSQGADLLLYGAHRDDWAGDAYPDCSPDFVEAMARAVSLGSGGALALEAPFVGLDKERIVAIGLELGVPYGLTWSCYEGGERPCGACGTCIDRARAFEANGAADPLLTGDVFARRNRGAAAAGSGVRAAGPGARSAGPDGRVAGDAADETKGSERI